MIEIRLTLMNDRAQALADALDETRENLVTRLEARTNSAERETRLTQALSATGALLADVRRQLRSTTR